MATSPIADGIYFAFPDGGCWQAVRIRDGQVVDSTSESLAETHRAARDSWAGIEPSEADEPVDAYETHASLLDLFGYGPDAVVVVTRQAEI